jgi:hypothetical protein
MKKFFTSATLCGLALVFGGVAHADILTVTAIGSPVAVAGGQSWTYSVSLSTTETILPPPSTDFGTLYGFDFGSKPATVTATGLLATSFAFTETPASSSITYANGVSIGGMYPTCATCDNIRFTYTGTTAIPASASPTPLGTFTVISSNTGPGTLSQYDGQAYSSTVTGAPTGNHGPILVASAVPEPISVSLLGGGLALIGIARWRRKAAR